MICGSLNKTAVFMVSQSFAELGLCERFKASCVPPAEFCLCFGVEENLYREEGVVLLQKDVLL